jgi:hypothetical protein
MSFVPITEKTTLGKKVLPVSSTQFRKEFLFHNEAVDYSIRHAGKRVTGPQKPFRLNDELSSQHRSLFSVDNADLSRPRNVPQQPAESLERPKRSHTSMDTKIEFAPLETKINADAQHFVSAKSNLSAFLGFAGVAPQHRGLRLAERKAPPPTECEVPGFGGMGNPFLVVPNERPNQAAAQRNNAIIGKHIPFVGERKNNIWSVYEE